MARQIRIRTTRKTAKTARSLSSALSAVVVLGLMVFMTAPVLAHHKDDHAQGGGESVQQADHEASSKAANSDHDGDADSDSDTAYTEDNDTNDGVANNVSDDGDNAHPSGNDRSVENGSSGTQGKAESNPDDSKGPERFEGARGDDKANGPGGQDLADQDGNNGCGNDDDFDDDNNGHCGKPAAPVTTSIPPPTVLPDVETEVCPLGTDRAGQPMTTLVECDEDDVLGREDLAEPKDDDVLGNVIQKVAPTVVAAPAIKGAVLPFTGALGLVRYLLAGLALMAIGIVAMRVARY
jgi:multisubunit Na+/H+ antiporter MnhG subunit